MNKFLKIIPVAAVCLLAGSLSTLKAQEDMSARNTLFNLYIGEVHYEHAEKTQSSLNKVGSAMLDVLQGSTVKQLSDYVPAVGESMKRGTMNVPRLIVKEVGDPQQVQEGDLLLTGAVTSIGTINSLKDKSVPTDNKAFVELTVTLKDLAHNEIIGTRHFKRQVSATTLEPSAEKELPVAISALAADVHGFLRSMFPIYGEILEKGLEKKNKLKQVYINLGENFGLCEGQHFTVYKMGMVSGRETKSETGRVKVVEVQGEDISLCKVSKGGDAIKAALENGTKLILIGY